MTIKVLSFSIHIKTFAAKKQLQIGDTWNGKEVKRKRTVTLPTFVSHTAIVVDCSEPIFTGDMIVTDQGEKFIVTENSDTGKYKLYSVGNPSTEFNLKNEFEAQVLSRSAPEGSCAPRITPIQ